MDKNTHIKKRDEWLGTLKKITENCFEREARLGDLCPQRYSPLDQKEKRESLKKIARLSKEISVQIQHLNRLEQGGGFGFSVVLGSQPDELMAVVLSLLVSARLDCAVGNQIRAVQDVINFTAIRNPATAAQVRSLFRSDSALFRLVVLGQRGFALDQFSCTIRESILNRILCQQPDDTEARCEAEVLVGRGDRR